jgi:sugar phosphate isomerase/epimerase
MQKISISHKKKSKFQIVSTIFFLLFSMNGFSQKANKPTNLLDDKLTYWYKWMGIPHTSVQGLPEGTAKGDGMNGTPMGMNDPKQVFKIITLNNEKVLRASGEIYGGLTTKSEYQNYHLRLKYKWGTKKWEPRLNLPKDCGIMYHLTGTNEDAFWSTFLMGIECQISEKNSGELFLIPNKNYSIRPCAEVTVSEDTVWNVNAPLKFKGGYTTFPNHFVNRSENFESNPTEWTTIDVYTIGSSAVHLVNGHVVMAFQNAGIQKADMSITPLTKGKIQLQSEGAEVFYKDITIEEITDFPTDIKKLSGLNLAQNWKLGVGLWTFHTPLIPSESDSKTFNTSSVAEQLEIADKTGLKYVEGFSFSKAGKEFKDSVMMNLSVSGIKKLSELVKVKGLKMESIYITGGKSIADWKRDFEIAKALNVKYVAAEPPVNMWDSVDSLAGKYGIKVAIHNHWKGVSVYWHPDSVLVALKNHPNFGACPDLGHYPKSGINPVDALKKLEGHIIGIHLKDIAEYNKPDLKDVPLGMGVIDFAEVFKELKRQHFNGNIIIESDVEDNGKGNNLNSVNQTIANYHKIHESLQVKK